MIKKFLKLIICVFLFFNFSQVVFSSNWTLACKKFSYSQNIERTESEEAFSILLPQLILEQISTGLSRLSPVDEILNRKLESLKTERLSLFLQLSKAIQERDSVVLTSNKPRKIKKLIAEKEKKIEEIKTKIDENLFLSNEYLKQFDETKESVEKKNSSFLEKFSNFFDSNSELEKLTEQMEEVVFYKNSISSLFSIPSDDLKIGVTSNEFEHVVVKEKINGLISGTIKTYGKYISVTASLHIYPGAKHQISVTEVGSIENALDIAKNIAMKLVPAITNNLPVRVYLDILSDSSNDDFKLTIDGIYYDSIPEFFTLNSGLHKIVIEKEGYITRSFSYNFVESQIFFVEVPMVKEEPFEISFNLLNPVPGSFFASGEFLGKTSPNNCGVNINVNGQAVLGQFISNTKSIRKVLKKSEDKNGKVKYNYVLEEGPPLSFFFYIPENMQGDKIKLAVNSKVQDSASIIDNRRIWSYRAYTALVLTLPFTLYSSGTLQASENAYASGVLTDQNVLLQNRIFNYVSIGATSLAAGYFVFELVRYLKAANSVLPQKIDYVTEEELNKALEKSNEEFLPKENFENIENSEFEEDVLESEDLPNTEPVTEEIL